MMNSLCACSNFGRKIETGLNYRANEAAINGDDGGESCLGGVRVSSREGDELHRAQQDADADASGSSQ